MNLQDSHMALLRIIKHEAVNLQLSLNERAENLFSHTNGINFTTGEKVTNIPEGKKASPSVRCGQYCTDEYLRS